MTNDSSDRDFDRTPMTRSKQAHDIMENAFSCVTQFTGAVFGQRDLSEALAYFRITFDLVTIVVQRTNDGEPGPQRIASLGVQSFISDRIITDRFDVMPQDAPNGSVLTARSSTGGIVLQIVLQNGLSDTDVILFEFPRLADRSKVASLSAMAPALAAAWQMRQSEFVASLNHSQSRRQKIGSKSELDEDILGATNPYGLSRSEFRVCRLLASGLKPLLIAQELGVSIATVRTHLKNIYAKTGLSGQLEVLSHIKRTSNPIMRAA
ncbi:MAG: helix-turn-helix transcriptional regulator [Sulfitobacter sp.]